MKKILLIEDEAQHILLVKLRLELNGFEVVAAQTAADGVAAAREHKPDLILLDLILPDMNAEETIKALRAIPSAAGTPILAFTALDTFEIHRRHLGEEIAGLIPKPYETYELMGKINGILAPDSGKEYGQLNPEI